MVTTTNFVGALDERVYRDLNDRVAKYIREDPQLNWLPVHQTKDMGVPEYKKPIFDESIGVKGAHTLGLATQMMETPKKTRVYDLEWVESDLYYDINDVIMESAFLVQKKEQELKVWLNQCKQSYFKGVFTKGYSKTGAGIGQRLNTGIIEQATLVENLDDANSQLIAAGDIYKALDKMRRSIPFRYRDGMQVLFGCDDLFKSKARTVLFRGATNQLSEFDLFFKELAEENPQGTSNEVRKPLIVSDKLFLNLVPGATKTETDTLGTHSRLFAAVIDPEIIEAAFSFNGMVGEKEEPTIRGVSQKWASRLAGCVHQAEAVVYSEQITWA